MKVYVKEHKSYAGKWIYQGYFNGWKALGYDVEYFNDLNQVDITTEYCVMTNDSSIDSKNIGIIANSKRTFIFVQPNVFPMPWGSHPNFISACPDNIIKTLNSLDNVKLWSWVDDFRFHTKWKNVTTIPLAFDNISYKNNFSGQYKYDVCYIGGWADNGFNEKKKIMINYFKAFMESDLRCGFFINKNISHKMENDILCNTKIAINLHDNYQRTLGLDTNERTFKSLGLCGILVSDDIKQLSNLFDNPTLTTTPEQMVKVVTELVNLSDVDLRDLKANNIALILKSHTYQNRIKELLKL